jgi:hypothetical protein
MRQYSMEAERLQALKQEKQQTVDKHRILLADELKEVIELANFLYEEGEIRSVTVGESNPDRPGVSMHFGHGFVLVESMYNAEEKFQYQLQVTVSGVAPYKLGVDPEKVFSVNDHKAMFGYVLECIAAVVASDPTRKVK